MGCVDTITAFEFPTQSKHVGRRATVIFFYNGPSVMGTVVRDDLQAPFRTIIQLDDGRFVLGTECQWSPGPDS